MWSTRKKVTKNPKYVVYRPQVLVPDLTQHIIEAQPPQIRIIARHTADLFVIGLLSLGTLWLVALSNKTAQSGAPAPAVAAYSNSTLAAGTANTLPTFLSPAPKKGPMRPVRVASKPQTPTADPCKNTTVLNIVAHQDDDLLFINPRISQALAQRHCVRTIYVTAGDDGRGADYFYLREAGAEMAYNVMLGSTKPWSYHLLSPTLGHDVMSASPEGEERVTLIFLRLPDGNLGGSGFESTAHESLKRLKAGSISAITTADKEATYTSEGLISTLASLLDYYRPVQINTQADDSSFSVTDHSDHIATGYYATVAAQQYASKNHVKRQLVHYFMGYPIRSLPSNLSEKDTMQKSAPFFAYAGDDPGVCTSFLACEESSSSYGAYLSRLYTQKR